MTEDKVENEFSRIFNLELTQKSGTKVEYVANEQECEAHEEDIEVILDKEIDAGEYIAEYLSLSINPYPRQDNVTREELGHKIITEEDVNSEPEKKNPFSVLKDLKHKT